MASTRPNLLNADPPIRLIRSAGYINKTLVAICAAEGLSKAGVKLDLQNRIVERLQYYVQKNDAVAFDRLRKIVENPNGTMNGGMGPSPAINAANSYLSATNHAPNNMGGGPANVYGAPPVQRLEFKQSPFYTVEEQLGGTKVCEVMAHHRHTVSTTLRVSDYPILARVVREPSLRVMVFCAGDSHGRQDVAFPHQSEIKVNSGEVKANLRGLKNKPGSTRPVDVTKELRLNLPAYNNNVEMTYALTTKVDKKSPKKFHFAIYVVKNVPVAELVKKLEVGKRITEKSVLDEMATKARDVDIVTTASVLSLKCPLSTLRIDLPIRSTTCRHNQCFDATSYLQLQEQGPTWQCPICNNTAPFDSLAVDDYVKDILVKTPRSTDQVIVQPDGKWEMNAKKENANNSRSRRFTSESDDDLIEVTKSGDSVRMGTPQVLKTAANKLAIQSRETSTSSPAATGSTSGKRPISAVIDLTSSGDEEDAPPARPSKRPFTTSNAPPPNQPAYRPAPPY